MSLLLSIETSTAQGSVALFDDDKLLGTHVWHRQKSHGELVTSQIETLFKTAGIEFAKLNGIAVTSGPGSFTGLRVGVNLAKTLGYSLGIPIMEFSSLEVMAAQVVMMLPPVIIAPVNNNKSKAKKAHEFLVMMDAHDGHFFVCRAQVKPTLRLVVTKPKTISYVELPEFMAKASNLAVVTESPKKLTELSRFQKKTKGAFVFQIPIFPAAQTLGWLCQTQAKKSRIKDWKNLTPLYIRPSGAEEKLKKK